MIWELNLLYTINRLNSSLNYVKNISLLDSLWAMLFAIPIAVLMVIRTSLEDRMLQDELTGYKEYIRQVKYRLLPEVW